MSTPEERLAELGLTVPDVVPPVAAYVPAVRVGSLVYTAGQLPMRDGALIATGKVGHGVTVEAATACAQQCALNAIAAIRSIAGDLASVRIVKVVVFVASDAELHRPARRRQRRVRAVRHGLRRARHPRSLGGRRDGAAARLPGRGRGHRGDPRLRIPLPPVPLPEEFVQRLPRVRRRHPPAGRAAQRRDRRPPAARGRRRSRGLPAAPPGHHGLRRWHVRLPGRWRRPA